MEHGLFFIGWAWMQKAELTYNVNHGWMCIVDPVKHQRKVVENTNKQNPLCKGAIVNLPLDLLNRHGEVRDITYHENYCVVRSNGEDFIVSKSDIFRAL